MHEDCPTMPAVCPQELPALDANALTLWPKLLKRASVTISKNEIVLDRRGWILKNLALPDLKFRLQCQKEREGNSAQDELARAKIWFHVAESSAPGDSIPDLTADNRYALNPWIATPALKYENPRLEHLKRHQTKEPRVCANDRCRKGSDGQQSHAIRGKYCSNACRSSMGRRLPAKSSRRGQRLHGKIAA